MTLVIADIPTRLKVGMCQKSHCSVEIFKEPWSSCLSEELSSRILAFLIPYLRYLVMATDINWDLDAFSELAEPKTTSLWCLQWMGLLIVLWAFSPVNPKMLCKSRNICWIPLLQPCTCLQVTCRLLSGFLHKYVLEHTEKKKRKEHRSYASSSQLDGASV